MHHDGEHDRKMERRESTILVLVVLFVVVALGAVVMVLAIEGG